MPKSYADLLREAGPQLRAFLADAFALLLRLLTGCLLDTLQMMLYSLQPVRPVRGLDNGAKRLQLGQQHPRLLGGMAMDFAEGEVDEVGQTR